MQTDTHPFDNVIAALDALRSGKPIVVVDDEHRENEGDLVVAAEYATPDVINLMAREARGLVCIAMTGRDLDRLELPMMVSTSENGSRFGSPFTVSVDAGTGVTTGISAHDRSRTIQVLIDPTATKDDLNSPGHIFPLRAHEAGVLARRGHTEAGVDLAKLAGCYPAAVICEIMADDGAMARRPELTAFAERHDLVAVSIEALAKYRLESMEDSAVTALDSAHLPTRFGEFEVTAYRDRNGLEHLFLRLEGANGHPPLVRIHSECLTGDVLGSLRCDCGDQLQWALHQIAAAGNGALIYLRQEGRGIGLANKIRAYALQDEGLDTVEANTCLGFSPDLRDYGMAAAMLKDQGIDAVRLLTNNPRKLSDLSANGIDVVERLPIVAGERPENERYLRTKAEKLEHLLTSNAKHQTPN
jgi:3,4-dihydroxy 2-butanone 4-phosphate synthase/GTP cyclohydrolase II